MHNLANRLLGCPAGWPVELPPLSCWEVVKQGQGHSASPGARLYGADASDDPAGFFAISVDLHSTSKADTLADEDLCRKRRTRVAIFPLPHISHPRNGALINVLKDDMFLFPWADGDERELGSVRDV